MRAARCPASSRPRTSAPTCASSAAPGQGLPVLVAEVIVSELARRLDLLTPRLVALELEQAIARYEADEEVQDLLNASLGLNLGVDFLPGSFGFDPTLAVDPDVGGPDAVAGRVRRQRRPQLAQPQPAGLARRPLADRPRGVALLPPRLGWWRRRPVRFAAQPYDVDRPRPRRPRSARRGARRRAGRPGSTTTCSREVLDLVPDEWLEPRPGAESPDEVRAAYRAFLRARLDGARVWVPGRAAA